MNDHLTLGRKGDILSTVISETDQSSLSARQFLLEARRFHTQQELADRLHVTAKTIRRWEKGEITPPTGYIPAFREILQKGSERSANGDHSFTFIDLFAGIGGMRLGFEAAGGKCVFTSEWNPYAQKTYRENFPCDHEIVGDITKVEDKAEIPDHDLLVGGFPCQPFSIAGVSKKNALGRAHGFQCETQGTLFFEIEQILRVKKPKAFLLENVKNLVSHDKGNTFRVIVESLRNLGYRLGDGEREFRIIDGKAFVPQHRERTFIVGFREQTDFTWNDLRLPPQAEWPDLSRILHPEDGSETAEEPYTTGDLAKVSDKYVLTKHLWQYLKDYAAKHKAKGNGFGFGLCGPGDTARTLSARYYKDGSEILIRRGNKTPRRLTPRECARLMGFDNADRRFKIPVSDTQSYKQFGNAVVVPVVEAIAKLMKPNILRCSNPSQTRQQLLELAS